MLHWNKDGKTNGESVIKMKEKNTRIEWVDICKAIAIIFVFLGHWGTLHLRPFAFAFHLKLFFLISGFFASASADKYTFKEFLTKKTKQILIPMLLWMWIGLIITNFDTETNLSTIIYQLKDIRHIYPNYWFFPAIFTISIFYYISKKFYKSNLRVLLFTYLLILFFGKNPIIELNLPQWFIFNYIDLKAIFAYSFWFALGSYVFPIIKNIIEKKDESKKNYYTFHLLGFITTLISTILFLKDIEKLHIVERLILPNNILSTNYYIITSIIIIISVIYFSTFLTNIEFLQNIGKNTMSLMGLEFITRTIITVYLSKTIGIEITIDTTISVIVMVIIQFYIDMWIIKYINQSFPILNGVWKTKKVD